MAKAHLWIKLCSYSLSQEVKLLFLSPMLTNRWTCLIKLELNYHSASFYVLGIKTIRNVKLCKFYSYLFYYPGSRLSSSSRRHFELKLQVNLDVSRTRSEGVGLWPYHFYRWDVAGMQLRCSWQGPACSWAWRWPLGALVDASLQGLVLSVECCPGKPCCLAPPGPMELLPSSTYQLDHSYHHPRCRHNSWWRYEEVQEWN